MFSIIDVSNDRRISLQEFTMALPRLVDWGLSIARGTEVAVFNHIDRNHGGQVLFSEFCEWAIKEKLYLCEELHPSQVAGDRSLTISNSGIDWVAINKKLPYER